MFRKVIYNTGAQILGKALTASATLAITLLIGQTLGEAGYGDFTKIFTFVGYFYTLSDFGLNAIYIKVAKSEPIYHLKILLGLRLAMAIALVMIAIIVAFFLPYSKETNIGFSLVVKVGIAIAALTIITQAVFTTANAYFQKILRYDLSAISAAAGTIIVLVSVFLITLKGGSLLAFAATYVLGGSVFFIVAFFLILQKTKENLLPIFSEVKSKIFLRDAWPIGLSLIFNLIYFRADVFILASSRPSREVGLYGLAYQFFEVGLAIPIFFSNALYPPLMDTYQKSLTLFKKEVTKWLVLLTGFSAILLVFLLIISTFIPYIFQGRFLGSVLALRILALGMPLFFVSALAWHILIIFNKQKYLLFIYGFGALFNIIANLIFIPTHGYLAAAQITVISEALILILLALVVKQNWKI